MVRNLQNRAAGPWKSTVPAASFRGPEPPLSDFAAVGQNHAMNVTEAGVLPVANDAVVAASPAKRRSPARLAVVIVALVAGALAVAGFAATRIPEFYRQRLEVDRA